VWHSNPCKSKSVVDFFFIIDASPSMQEEIDTVKDGLVKFSAEIVKRGIDARYAVVLLGDEPEMVVDFTDDAQFLQAQFGRIRSTAAVANFQKYKGGQEAGFEAMRMALGKASQNKFYSVNVVKSQSAATGNVSWRTAAQKFFILLTDEDCDRPFYAANRIAGQTTEDPPSVATFAASAAWVSEVSQTASLLVQAKAVLYMFVNKNSGATRLQYGAAECDKSAANFLNFNASATQTCLRTGGWINSLQGRMLQSAQAARAFDTVAIQQPQFIQNFFVAAVDQVSKCEKKRSVEAVEDALQTQPCERYTCDTAKGCVVELTCAAGCTEQCLISGVCYDDGAVNPRNACQYCNPRTSRTAWHTCGVSPTSECGAEECKASKCVKSRKCTPQCGCCCFGGDVNMAMQGICTGTRYDAGIEEPGKPPGCSVCDPYSDFFAWTKAADPKVCNPSVPTCTDNIQNQNEELVDCGGPCAPCDKCKNGLMDGGEEGIDCGVAGAGPGCAGKPCAAAVSPDVCANGSKCLNGGKCVSDVCDCRYTGFVGTLCQTPEPKGCTPTCSNGGQCTLALACDCAGTGFQGATCTTPLPATPSTPAPGLVTPPDVCGTAASNACCSDAAKSDCAVSCAGGVDVCRCDPSTQSVAEKVCKAVTDTPFVPTPEESSNLPLIIGASVAGGVVLLVIVGLVIWKFLPNAASNLSYRSERHNAVQMKDSDVL